MNNKKIIAAVFLLSSFAASASQQAIKKALENDDLVGAKQLISALNKEALASDAVAILQGRLALQQGDTETAYDIFEELSEKQGSNEEVFYYLGLASATMAQKASIFSKLGYANDYIDAMDESLKINPEYLPTLKHLIGFHLFAPSIAGGDPEKAKVYAKQIIGFNEEEGLASLTQVYWGTEEVELADSTFEKAIKKFPESSKLYFVRGMHFMKAEAWAMAIKDLTSSVKYANNDEDLMQALYQQGKASAESGLALDSGKVALEQLLTMDGFTNRAWGQYRLAQVLVKNDQINEAKQVLSVVKVGEDERLADKVEKLREKLSS